MAKNKKHKILSTATQLFANQGFDNTTTLQIAKEAGVTEPLLYYHFKGKEEIFTEIIRSIFQDYEKMLEELPRETETEFEKINNLIRLHIHMAENRPNEGRLILANCPSKLKNESHTCQKIVDRQQEIIVDYLRECLEKGNASGEFDAQSVDHLVVVMLCLINGILRKKLLGKKEKISYEYTAIDFCRKAIVKQS
ncbi:TetR/AcrR family transcriptional regulator [Desulfonatronospira sp. MSAO_Bac3]|uniref:TetR/AcrR family transcriptional regulator n=1 Tax=Desulfonatronospira sp. MSAO_Bac3 TaxID=2293857 RepID=UPI000FF274C2|nr:TetR/AcrR family transcriptional regulator [Desulfonatronospira sp. MSAO_Bac3]RQD77700.1 MAG: TetR/AcrR family transcriptional regulator [Desulfonatronospira sp. MSAO_Bac3]